MVAGQQANRADDERRRARCRHDEQEAEAHRSRSLSLQERRGRLSRLDAHASLRVRRSRRGSRRCSRPDSTTRATRMVARQQVDRVREHARPRRHRSLATTPTCSSSKRAPARRPSSSRRSTAPTAVRSRGVPTDRCSRISAAATRSTARTTRIGSRSFPLAGGPVANPHRRARSPGDVAALHGRRKVDRLSRHRRSRALHRERFPSAVARCRR